MTMYEAWLMLNIVWEILLTAWPLTLALLLLVAGLGLAALLARGAAWRSAWPVALAGAAIVGVASFLLLPGLTRSSLGELKYWVDWMALAGLAGGFAALAAALLWPLMALLKRQPI
jgi:hypothetical protein